MGNGDKNNTILYVSVNKSDDEYIDALRIQKMREEKRHMTKTEVAKELLLLGIDVINGKYLKLDPSIDSFVAKLQDMTIEMKGNKIIIKKSKEQVYLMLIEKGLQHLSD